MKRRRGVTPPIRDSWIEQWEKAFRSGHYQPFLRTEDVPSSGNRARVRGVTSGRVHHLMSYNETLTLARLDHDPHIVQIMEQYPLLPVGRTVRIARELGIRHPMYPQSRTYVVLTTDFVTKGAGGERRAHAVKARAQLAHRRTQELLTLERAYWLLEGVPWEVVTDAQVRTIRHRNLLRLQPFGALQSHLLLLELSFLTLLSHALRARPHEAMAAILGRVAQALAVPYSTAVAVFYHGLWTGAIGMDLEQPLTLRSSPANLGISVGD